MFQIKSRITSKVLFECELDAEVAVQSYRFRLGFAVRKAVSTDANLTGANLADANLAHFRSDMIAEILKLPDELEALRTAIIGGLIDGSSYSGDCACLAGTLAKARGLPAGYSGESIVFNGMQFIADSSSPRERWFMMIKPGDTPDTNQASRLALEWVNEAIAIRDIIRKSAVVL